MYRAFAIIIPSIKRNAPTNRVMDVEMGSRDGFGSHDGL